MDALENRPVEDGASVVAQAPGPVDVRRAAMNLLARREHSRTELKEKLLRRFDGSVALIEAELDRLADEDLQSDSRMAGAFVRSRVRRGQGPVRIRMELARKGIGDELVEQVFADEAIDWFVIAREVAERKYRDLDAVAADLKLKGKLSRFLQQRGFTFDHIAPLV